MIVFEKTIAPLADKPVTINWTRWLNGDTLATVTWASTNAAKISIHDSTVSASTIAVTFVKVEAGGVPGDVVEILCSIITASSPPRKDSRKIVFTIAQT